MRKRFTQEYHPITNASIDGTSEIPHDRACLRAIQSKYKVNATGSVSRTLFVGRLSYKTTEETLRHHFGIYDVLLMKFIYRKIWDYCGVKDCEEYSHERVQGLWVRGV